MNHRLRELQEQTKEAMNLAKESVKETSKLKDQMEKDKEVTNKRVDKCETDIFEEMNLREEKRKNIVIHGATEPDGADGKSRMEADKRQLDHIFTVLDINISVDADVEFCRRIGEKAERSRPLIVGFYSEWAKSVVLKNSKFLAGSELENITIAPDLTERQRKAEKGLAEEAERRNLEELTPEDRAKNWVWKVVGKKGKKKLIKGYDNRRGEWTRGRGRGEPGPGSRGRGQLLPPLPSRGTWAPVPGTAGRGRGADQGTRKRRLSGEEERTRKRGTGRGRPPLRTRAASMRPSQTENEEEEDEQVEDDQQEESSQLPNMMEQEEEMEETGAAAGARPAGIRLGEE
jgi:hypothetical protein